VQYAILRLILLLLPILNPAIIVIIKIVYDKGRAMKHATWLFVVLFGLGCAAPAFAVFTWVRDGAFPADTTAATGFPVTTGIQGLAIDGEGKIWIQSYLPFSRDNIFVPKTGEFEGTCALYIYYANGTQAPFSPLKFVTIGTATDTLGGRVSGNDWIVKNGLGLAADGSGDILAMFHDTVYLIDHQSGAGIAKAVYGAGIPGTAPAAARTAGDIFAAAVEAGLPVKEYDTTLNYQQDAAASRAGTAHALAAAADGNTLYLPSVTENQIFVHHRTDGSSPWSPSGSILQGFACESMTWDPAYGSLWASAGSYQDLPNQFADSSTSYFPNTWYAYDLTTSAIVDSLKWHFYDPESPDERPRAIAVNTTSSIAYVACYPHGGVLRFVRRDIASHPITFRVDMSVLEAQGSFDPLTDSVFVMGNFNGWDPTSDQMVLTTMPHVYEYTTPVYYGRPVWYNFVYVHGGTEHAETIDIRSDIVEPGGQILPTVYFNDQTEVMVSANVTFQADMTALLAVNYDPAANEMRITGEFNGWANEEDWVMSPVAGNPALYTLTAAVMAPQNSTQAWKFAAYPGSEFVNGGLEIANTLFTFTGNDMVLPARAPQVQFLPAITITAPNGGEHWRAGTAKKITWSTHMTGNVKLEYQTTSGGAWSEIVASTSALDESFIWTLPAVESSSCKVRATSLADGSVSDESDAVFTITQVIPTAESESNNTASLGNWIDYGDSLDAAISPDGDVDYYRFWGAEGDTAEIWGHCRGDSTLAGRIILYMSDGTGLYQNNGYLNPPLDQRIACVLPADGLYYIRYSFMDNWGTWPNRELVERLEDEEREKLGIDPELQWTVQGEYRIGLRRAQKGSPVITAVGVYNQFWDSVQLYGYLDPRDESTTVQFEYGPTISYGTTVAAEGGPFTGVENQFVSSPIINGLTAESIYHMRMNATNALGSTSSWDFDFHTPPQPEGWERKISGSTRLFNDVYFLDDNTGIIVGDSLIMRTTDGGETWTQLYSGIWTRFKGICFASSTTGYVMGSYGHLLKTTDTGQTWNAVNSGTGLYLFAGYFPTTQLGWIACDAGLIIHTTNGGSSWEPQDSGLGTNLRGVYFFNETTGMVVGEDSTILRTTNGGATWTPIASPSYGNYLAIHFADSQTGVIVGKEDFLLRTTDGGLTWTEVSIAPYYYLTDIHFYEEGYAIAVGRDGTILRTSDNGATWSLQRSGTLNDLHALHHAGTHTTIIGANQTILRSADFISLKSPNGGETWSPGSVQDIVWWSDLGGNMQLDYRTGSTSGWLSITASTPAAAGSYAWTLPAITSDSCKVRITSLVDGSYVDESDSLFSIRVTSVQQKIRLNAGWNMISSYIDPPDSTLPTLLGPLGSHLTIAKNNSGQVYWPAYGINTIGKWKPLQGYKCYLTALDSLIFTGDQLPPEATPIALTLGWNTAAYLRTAPLLAPTALASIVANLTIAKNMAGQVYWPLYSINTIGNLLPGQGYQIYVTAAVNLTYPANSTGLAKESLAEYQTAKPLQHFTLSTQATGNSAVLLVQASYFREDDEVAVYGDDGSCLGAGVVQRGQVPITIWGDDEQSKTQDGARNGDRLLVVHWCHSSGNETPVKIEALMDGVSGSAVAAELCYQNEAVWVARAADVALLPREFALRQNYPNPFNPATHIRYEMPKESMIQVVVYNLQGQAIRTLVSGKKKAGFYEAVWDGRNQRGLPVSSGLYFVRMEAGHYVKVIKMSLIK
jgi:photosystem II stability/assembly factor-like uncharacterized protein